MVEVLRITEANGSRSTLMENKFTNVVLYNLFKVKKYSTSGTVRSIQQIVIPVFPPLSTVAVDFKYLNFIPIITL